GFNDALALQTLEHKDPYVRLWTTRLLGDEKKVTDPIARKLADLARKESQVEVRVQLTCSARRLPATEALPIIRNLLTHDEDSDDIYQPLLLWWAIESKCESDRERVLALFEDPAVWDRRLVRTHL